MEKNPIMKTARRARATAHVVTSNALYPVLVYNHPTRCTTEPKSVAYMMAE